MMMQMTTTIVIRRILCVLMADGVCGFAKGLCKFGEDELWFAMVKVVLMRKERRTFI